MNLLKRIPIRYIGELHDIRLINFSVGMQEVLNKIPASIKPRDFGGRALFSMVDVKLKKMHPSFVPSFCNFGYRHVAFRLLVEDAQYNKGHNKGIFFYRSFTDHPLIVLGGKLLTNYNLESAQIHENGNKVIIRQGKDYVKYCTDNSPSEGACTEELNKTIGALDRAYSFISDKLMVTEIQTEKWPIQPVRCTDFENTFFKTARMEGAFRVFETIYYQWLSPKAVVSL